MNTAKFIEDQVNKGKQEELRTQIERIQSASEDASQLLFTINRLRKNPNYINFKEKFLDDAVSKTEKQINLDIKELANDSDGKIKNRILQNQGMMVAFKKFANLEEFEEVLKVENQRLNNLLKEYGKA